jgi:hypothetical protein
MTWAVPQDIIDRWIGNDAPTDTDLMTALITDAESVILAEYPSIQARITADTLPLATVTMVVARMVIRMLRNPDIVTYWQQQTGPFGQARNFGESDIWLTDQEISMLAPANRGKAFEVNQGWNALDDSDDLIWFEVR